MKRLLSIVLLFYLQSAQSARGQQLESFEIKGMVGAPGGAVLEGATVLLHSSKDSTLITFGRTSASGVFQFKGIRTVSLFLSVSFVGYKRVFLPLPKITDGFADFGLIGLVPVANELGELVVKGEGPPVRVRNDTIEYNADSFKTQPNSVVEDLLKKFPGVEVENDGTIKAQGETVQRVTVDGKEFFGRDPRIAPKNLPADAIDKVQIFDRKSDKSQFTGIDDGKREKTMNLTIKESKRNMVFGSLMGAGGSDSRYSTKVNLNRFSKSRQFALLGMGNNINQQGFSIVDYLSYTGAAQRMAGGGGRVSFQLSSDEASDIPLNFGGRTNGFLKNWAGGFNFNTPVTSKTELNGSYFYNNLNQDVGRNSVQSTFLNNGSFQTREQSKQLTRSEAHRLNFTVDHKLDSTSSLRWVNRGDYRINQGNTTSSSSSWLTKEETETLQNQGDRASESNGTGWRLNSDLLYRKKFRKHGRTAVGNVTLDVDQNDRDGLLQAENRFYGNGGQLLSRNAINQANNQLSKNVTYGGNLTYTEPLSRQAFLEFNYSLSRRLNELTRRVFDIDAETGEHTVNTQLTNSFENTFTYHRVGMNFQTNRKNWNASVGVNWQRSILDGKLITQATDIRRTFGNILPQARLQYRFSNSRNLNLTFDTDVREPGIQQLSPIVDNTDPLNIVKGNPALRPEYNSTLRLQYSSFNQLNFSNFSSFVNLIYGQNKIVQGQTINEQLVRTYEPINTQNNWTLTANLNKGFRIKAINTRFSVATNLMYNQGETFVNGEQTQTSRVENRNTLRLDYRLADQFNLAATARITLNKTRYAINRSLDQYFVNQNYIGELNWNIPRAVNFNVNLDYSLYRFAGSDFNQRIPLLGASVSRTFLKSKRAELKLAAVDLLNRNVIITRTAMANFVRDEQIRSLGRYFLLSFTYAIKGSRARTVQSVQVNAF